MYTFCIGNLVGSGSLESSDTVKLVKVYSQGKMPFLKATSDILDDMQCEEAFNEHY